MEDNNKAHKKRNQSKSEVPQNYNQVVSSNQEDLRVLDDQISEA